MGLTVNPQKLHDHAFRVSMFEPKIDMAKDAAGEISGLDWHISYGLMCQFFPIALIPVNNYGKDLLGKLRAGYGATSRGLSKNANDYGQADKGGADRMFQIMENVNSGLFGNSLVDPKAKVRPEDYGPKDPTNLKDWNPFTAGQGGNWTSGLKVFNDMRILYDQANNSSKRNVGIITATIASAGIGGFTLMTDPIGTLASMGAGWAMDHIKPLKVMLDGLAGNPDMIKGAANSWNNIATHLDGVGNQYADEVGKGTREWTGAAADAYRTNNARNLVDATKSTGMLAKGMSVIVATTGEIVSHVRTFVRDVIASLVGDLVKAGLKRLVGLSGGPVEELGKIAAMTKLAKSVVDKMVSCFKGTKAIVGQLLDLAKTASRIVPLLNGI